MRLAYIVVAVGGFIAIFGIFKYLGENPFPWGDYKNPQHSGRLISTYYNANHLAGLMEMTLPITVGLLLTGLSRYQKAYIGVLITFMACALILSLSRGGWTGALAGFAVMGVLLGNRRYFRSSKPLAFSIVVILAISLVAISSAPTVDRALTMRQGTEMDSLSARIQVWASTIDVIRSHPALGTGPGTFALAFTRYQPPGFNVRFEQAHNDYLHFFSEVGLFLVPVLLWMILAVYSQAFRKINSSSRLIRGTVLGATGAFTAILVHSTGDFNLLLPANAVIFCVMVGIVIKPLTKNDNRMNR
jgi:O-antigen ligase